MAGVGYRDSMQMLREAYEFPVVRKFSREGASNVRCVCLACLPLVLWRVCYFGSEIGILVVERMSRRVYEAVRYISLYPDINDLVLDDESKGELYIVAPALLILSFRTYAGL